MKSKTWDPGEDSADSMAVVERETYFYKVLTKDHATFTVFMTKCDVN